MTLVKLENAAISYPFGPTIGPFCLDMDANRAVAVVGPSGGGKTTLLRMIAGLEPLSTGELFLNEKNVAHVPPRDRNIGFVFQSTALYPTKTVLGNVAFPLVVRGKTRQTADSKALSVLDQLGIRHLATRRVSDISGGEAQRVAIGRALITDPFLMLLDEPLSHLDVVTKDEIVRLLVTIRLEGRTTQLFVSHDREEVLQLADWVLCINGGLVEQYAPVAEAAQTPESLFIARFLAREPLIEFALTLASLNMRDGVKFPQSCVQGLTGIPQALLVAQAAGLSYVALEAGGREGFIEIPFRVERQRQLSGDRMQALLQTPLGGAVITASRPLAVTAGMIQIDPIQTHLFDAATGRRVVNWSAPAAG